MLKEEYGGPHNIRNIHDVLRQNLTIATKSRGIIRKNVRNSDDDVYKQLSRRLEGQGHEAFVGSVEEGLAEVRTNMNYVFLVADVVANYVSSRAPCTLTSVPVTSLMHESFALLVNKNSPALLQRVNRAIISLSQTGVIEELYRKWWNIDAACDDDSDAMRIHVRSPDQFTRFSSSAAAPSGLFVSTTLMFQSSSLNYLLLYLLLQFLIHVPFSWLET